ncbi:MAG: c-type cytochrome domain-containing protein, partial [Planctomycetota bacterium]|nr:c-type cytochrome domain-containing protein [Planctomycetota bacterium]
MTRSRIITGLLPTLLFVSLIHADETKPSPEGIEFFESKIRPVLVQHCYQCHAVDAKNIQGGLVLDSREGTLKGGDSGPSVVPKNPAESLVISALKFESFEMPPKGRLSDEIIADFEKWIEMGAPDPRDGATIAKSDIDFEEGRKHWAYQPVQMPERPKVKNKAWPQNNIDYFTLTKMEEHGLSPVSPAS